MSPFTIRPAQRSDVKLIASVAGPSGAGKTYTALKLARGLAGDNGKIVLCDTEHGRSQTYADVGAPWEWIDFQPPFSPDRYIEALKAAEAANPAVVVVDSVSHEYEGEGGLFDLVEQFLQKRAGDDTRKRAALSFSAWDYAKREHKKLLLHMLRMPCHLVLAMRAQDKIDLIREGGQLKAVPKKSLTGLDGWIPICERRLPYEMSCSFLLLPDRPGVPRPLKPMPPTMAPLVPLDRPLDEQTGRALAEWAKGAGANSGAQDESAAELPALITELLELSDELGKRDVTTAAIGRDRQKKVSDLDAHAAWLRGQIASARKAVEKLRAEPDEVLFPGGESDAAIPPIEED